MKTLHKCFIAIAFLFAFLFSTASFCQTPEENTAYNWFLNYREHPDISKILPNLAVLTQHCADCVDCCYRMSIMLNGFLSAIVEKNPDKLETLAKQFNDGKKLEELIDATLFSGLPNAVALAKNLVKDKPAVAKEYAKELSSSTPPEIDDMFPWKDPDAKLSFWYGEYLASGDAAPIENTIKLLKWYDKKAAKQTHQNLQARAIARFLAVSIKTDKRLLAICKNYEKKTKNKKVATLLKKIIAVSKEPLHSPESSL